MKLAPRTITGVGAPAFGINTGRSSLQGVRASYLTTATTALNNSTSAYDLNFRRSMEYTLAAVNGLGIAATVNNLVQRAAKTSLKSGFFPLAKALMNLAIGSATAALRQGGLAGLPTGFGALNTADPTLASTSSALSDSLNASGCQQSAQQNVKDFQSAYNNAGGFSRACRRRALRRQHRRRAANGAQRPGRCRLCRPGLLRRGRGRRGFDHTHHGTHRC